MKPVFARYFEALKAGLKMDDELGQRRLAVCAECPFFDAGLVRCRKCRCFLKLKAPRVASQCPIKRWETS